MIPEELLESRNTLRKKYAKGDIIFSEGDLPVHYFQIIQGEVKMCNFNDDGSEFTQGFFHNKHSFGEPPLFLNHVYPANAIAVSDCKVFVLLKPLFVPLKHWKKNEIKIISRKVHR